MADVFAACGVGSATCGVAEAHVERRADFFSPTLRSRAPMVVAIGTATYVGGVATARKATSKT